VAGTPHCPLREHSLPRQLQDRPAREAHELAESSLAIEKRKFGEGLASSFEVAASEDELFRAEQAEVDAIVTYLNTLTRLDRVSGRTLERWNVRLETVPP